MPAFYLGLCRLRIHFAAAAPTHPALKSPFTPPSVAHPAANRVMPSLSLGARQAASAI